MAREGDGRWRLTSEDPIDAEHRAADPLDHRRTHYLHNPAIFAISVENWRCGDVDSAKILLICIKLFPAHPFFLLRAGGRGDWFVRRRRVLIQAEPGQRV